MEGYFHKTLKKIVAQELENQHYSIYYEPLESPLNLLWWHSYRPDILAIKKSDTILNVGLIECETKPNKKRVLTKTMQIKKNLSLQKQLLENTIMRPLLIIPPNNLQKIICSKVRRFWEIWIINHSGTIKHKISPTKKGG